MASAEHYQLEYPMTAPSEVLKRGFGLIIVNHFYQIDNFKREGSENEVRNLERLFSSFGLHVLIYEEMVQSQILVTINDISKNPLLENHSVFMLAISSHGTKDGLLGVDKYIAEHDSLVGKTFNDIVSHQSIIRTFNSENCPFLLGKPKVFIFNGCRGDEKECLYFSDAILHTPTLNQIYSSTSADFLVLFSCVDGYQSLRKGDIGSSFIHILTETWMQLEDIPLENTLAYINRRLINSTKHFDHQLGQIIASCCTFHSTLRYTLKIPRTKLKFNQIIQPMHCREIPVKPVLQQQLAHLSIRANLRWSCVNEGEGKIDLKRPRSLVLSSEGLLYVADCVNNRIQVYNKDTQQHVKCYSNIEQPLYLHISENYIYATSLAKTMKISISNGTISKVTETGINVRGITVDENNYIYVTEKLSLHIRILNEDFRLMKRMRLETPYKQSTTDSTTQISDIKYYKGELFVLFENSEYTVQAFTMTGYISNELISHYQVPLSRHFYVGSEKVIISDLKSMKIKVFSTLNSTILVEINCDKGPGALTQPFGVAFDPLTNDIFIVDHVKKVDCLMCYNLFSNT